MAGPTSQNGYWANRQDLLKTYTVPGSSVRLRLREGAPGEILVYLAERYHREVEPLDPPGAIPDNWSYAEREIRGSTTTLSNHASGTAIDLRATRHPLGVRGTFTPAQVRAIRRILADLDGCVRWGGDYTGRADEMHFEIDADPYHCARTLARLRTPAAPSEEDDMPTPDEISTDLLGTKLGSSGPTVGVALQSGFAEIKAARAEVAVVNDKLDALGSVVAQLAETVAKLTPPEQQG